MSDDRPPTSEEIAAQQKELFGDNVVQFPDAPPSHDTLNRLLTELRSTSDMGTVAGILNRRFAFVIDGGKARVAIELNRIINTWDMSAFKDWASTKILMVTSINPFGGKSETPINLYAFWLKCRIEYIGFSFTPGTTFDRNDRTCDLYDTWRDWDTVAHRGNVLPYLEFFYKIICNSDREHYTWVMSWIAQLIQHPEDPKGVALVLIGLKGIGKTFFSEIICSLLGERYSYTTADRNDIFGKFSGHLTRLIFLVLEEAIWAKNHQNEAILKVLVTGKRRTSHAKYHDQEMVPNFLRLLILGNPGWVIPTSQDERRYSVLKPLEEKINDTKYFGGLQKLNDNGGLGALMNYFRKYSLKRSNVDLRIALKTVALQEQQEEGREPIEVWLLDEFCWTGIVKCSWLDINQNDNGDCMKINRGVACDMFSDWCKKMVIKNELNSRQFGIKFGEFFPQFDQKGNERKSSNGRVISIFSGRDTTNNDGHVYVFPSLKRTREIIKKKRKLRADYWDESVYTRWDVHPMIGTTHLDAPPIDVKIVSKIVEGSFNVVPFTKDQGS